MEIVILILAVMGTLAVFATSRAGHVLRKRVGLRDGVPGAASSEDVAFLIRACDGDRDEAARRVAFERDRLPDLREADHYRRAIRRVLAERDR